MTKDGVGELPPPAAPQREDDGGTWEDAWAPVPRVLAGRYRVDRVAGAGGSGTVYVAEDGETGERVACKLLHGPADPRLPREIKALQRLDAPGVVRLRQVTEHDGHPLLVMDLVEGAPWPGPLEEDGVAVLDDRERWRMLRPRLRALLTVLARVHAAGVVHRDLKPSNVLVDDDGAPTILDFGLARGRGLGTTITRRGTLVGTPRYLSPEVMSGLRPDGRADLYSVGVMVFEALAGRPPHQAEDFVALHRARTGAPAPHLRLFRAGVPQAAADLVADLLRRDPDERPPSADAVLRRLGADPGAERFPWLGATRPVEDVVDAVCAGRPVRVGGPPGSGRSRVLREAATRLAGLGRAGHWLVPGARPFESLGALIEDLDLSALPPAEVGGTVRGRLQAALAAGPLFVDDLQRVDRWSRGLLQGLDGPLVTVVPPGSEADVRLGLLSAVELRPLFHGPDRFLHLREDAAALLHARTAGVPARIAATIDAWVAEAVVRWEDGRLRVDRSELDREAAQGEAVRIDEQVALDPSLADTLRWVLVAGEDATRELLAAATGRPAWELSLELAELVAQGALVEAEGGRLRPLARPADDHPWSAPRVDAAHRAIGEALPVGSVSRVRHRLTGGALDDLLPEASAAAVALWREGRLSLARALLAEVLEVVATDAPAAERGRAAGLLVRLAIADGTADARAHTAGLVQRFAPRRGDLDLLLQAAGLAVGDGAAQALSMLEGLSFPDEPHVEVGRQVVRMRAVRVLDPAREAALLDELDAWAADVGGEAAALVQGWRGLQAYREGRFLDAAALHEQAAAGKETVTGRLSSMLNAASALMEGCRLEEAQALAAQAQALAREKRQARFEARAWMLERSAVSRLRTRGVQADLAALDDLSAVAGTVEVGVAALVEARFAWHYVDREVCLALARLAEEAGRAGGADQVVALAGCLRLALRDREGPSPGDVVRSIGASTPSASSLELEAHTLLFLAGVEDGSFATGAHILSLFPEPTWSVARGFFAPVEMAGILAGDLIPPVLEL